MFDNMPLANIIFPLYFVRRNGGYFRSKNFFAFYQCRASPCPIFIIGMLNIPEKRPLFIKIDNGAGILPSVSPTGH